MPASPGAVPVSGAGTRLMWYPDKAALRAGQVSGTQWNKDSIGLYSIAMGQNTKAKGEGSVALGIQTTASGISSVAFGNGSIASTNYSTAIGYQNVATGLGSIAMGYQSASPGTIATAFGEHTRASGDNTTSFGNFTIAKPYASLVLGQYNDTSALSLINWNVNDPVFIIGNGIDENNRSNAITVLKNARTGINTATPDAMLHVNEGAGGSIYNSAAELIIEDDAASYLQFSNPTSFESGILSGNSLTSLRSAMIFRSDSSVQIRSGGGNTRLHVRQDGNIGIGTTSPQRLLHVSAGAGGNVFHGNADLIVEDNDATYLQLSSLTTDESGILSGNQVSSLRSAVMFRPDSSIQMRAGGNTTRLSVLKSGNVGINTIAPKSLFHVSAGASAATPIASAVAIFEDNTDVAINLLTPAADESAIYFGNPEDPAHGGIVYNSTVANGLAFRTNKNVTKMVLTDVGNVGIGDNTPNARMHISNGTGGGLYNAEADLIIEDNSQTYIQFSTPVNQEAGIFSGHSSMDIRSSLRFKSDSSVVISSGGTTSRLTILKNGNTGIATSTPEAKLDVNGTAIIGTNGTVLTEVIKVTVNLDIIPMLAGGSALETFAVPNATLGSTAMISPAAALQSGIIIAYARVSAAGTVETRFINTTTGAINPPPMDFYITVIK